MPNVRAAFELVSEASLGLFKRDMRTLCLFLVFVFIETCDLVGMAIASKLSIRSK